MSKWIETADSIAEFLNECEQTESTDSGRAIELLEAARDALRNLSDDDLNAEIARRQEEKLQARIANEVVCRAMMLAETSVTTGHPKCRLLDGPHAGSAWNVLSCSKFMPLPGDEFECSYNPDDQFVHVGIIGGE